MSKNKNKIIVIDGNNVAYEESTDEGNPKFSNIEAIRNLLLDDGYKKNNIIIIVDASLRHKIDDRKKLDKSIKNNEIRQVPSGTSADDFILSYANKFKATVLSNDTFSDYLHLYHWLSDDKRRKSFMIVNGEVEIRESIGLFPKQNKVKAPVKILNTSPKNEIIKIINDKIPDIEIEKISLVYHSIWHFKFHINAFYKSRGEIVDEINLNNADILLENNDELDEARPEYLGGKSSKYENLVGDFDFEVLPFIPFFDMKNFIRNKICNIYQRTATWQKSYYAKGGVQRFETLTADWAPDPRNVVISSSTLLYIPRWTITGNVRGNLCTLKIEAIENLEIDLKIDGDLYECPECKKNYLKEDLTECVECEGEYCNNCAQNETSCTSCGKTMCTDCQDESNECIVCGEIVCSNCVHKRGFIFKKTYCKACL